MTVNEKLKWFEKNLSEDEFKNILSICKNFVKENSNFKSFEIRTSEEYNDFLAWQKIGFKVIRVGYFEWKGKKKYIFMYGR
jgi:hypothetical protein